MRGIFKKVEFSIAEKQGNTVIDMDQTLVMSNFLFIHLRRKFIRIDFSDIKYVLAVGHHVKISTDQGVYLPHLSLKEMESVLPAEEFCRINRSTLVAIDRITCFDRETVTLKDVSFSFSDKFRKDLESKCTVLLHKDATPEKPISM